MKQILSINLIVLMAFILTACPSNENFDRVILNQEFRGQIIKFDTTPCHQEILIQTDLHELNLSRNYCDSENIDLNVGDSVLKKRNTLFFLRSRLGQAVDSFTLGHEFY